MEGDVKRREDHKTRPQQREDGCNDQKNRSRAERGLDRIDQGTVRASKIRAERDGVEAEHDGQACRDDPNRLRLGWIPDESP